MVQQTNGVHQPGTNHLYCGLASQFPAKEEDDVGVSQHFLDRTLIRQMKAGKTNMYKSNENEGATPGCSSSGNFLNQKCCQSAGRQITCYLLRWQFTASQPTWPLKKQWPVRLVRWHTCPKLSFQQPWKAFPTTITTMPKRIENGVLLLLKLFVVKLHPEMASAKDKKTIQLSTLPT